MTNKIESLAKKHKLLIIEDSAASNAKKRVQIGNLPGGGGSSDLTPAEAYAWFIG